MSRAEKPTRKDSKGGRPAKEAAEKASVKLNCWVTTAESQQIQTAYQRYSAGKKLAFSTYLKQIVLANRAKSVPERDELLLTLIIQLQENGRKLLMIAETIESKEGGCDDRITIQKVNNTLETLQETITKITTWLYES